MEFIGLLGLVGLLGIFFGRDKVDKLNDKISQHENFIADSQNLFARRDNLNLLNDKISEHDNFIAQSQKFFSAFDALEKKSAEQQKTIDSLKERLKSVDERLQSLNQRLKTLEDKKLDERLKKLESSQPSETKPLTIRDFHIDKTNAVLLGNKADFAQISAVVLGKLEDLTDFLNNAPEDKKVFLRQLDNYRKNLSKFLDKVKSNKFDADNFSEEATEAFFNVLKNYFLAVVPVAIFRGAKGDPKFFADFLKKVNAYLKACGVYTKLVEPKSCLSTDMLEFMDVVRKDTTQPAQDNLIDEVERPAYFLDYLNDDGKTESFCCEGRMVVLKIGDKK